jgi:hypothetical protein
MCTAPLLVTGRAPWWKVGDCMLSAWHSYLLVKESVALHINVALMFISIPTYAQINSVKLI